ncbi:MAG: hypothetical protein QF918_06400 [Pirellulaceae bacterium]|jgi:hypothetical protein|nr:hypothetical protein [Pirellulaceae bacterium]MDP6556878.1 hypothetical protein [Pirellulaceae bacterium]MDP6721861.1 hypothetical protein [Pirellulaceae bacterium]
MNRKALGWTLLIVANVLVISVLSLHRTTDAAPQSARAPFGNSVEQRNNMIKELREIKVLLQEQNALLRDEKDDREPNVKKRRK